MKQLLATLAVLVLAAATPLSAQKKDNESRNTRSVQGVVMDGQDNPLDGAVVQLKNAKTLHINSFITKADGTYQFHNLNPDIDYELRAKFEDKWSDSRVLSSFDTRKQAVMNLKVQK